jgi:hypothetical protein
VVTLRGHSKLLQHPDGVGIAEASGSVDGRGAALRASRIPQDGQYLTATLGMRAPTDTDVVRALSAVESGRADGRVESGLVRERTPP